MANWSLELSKINLQVGLITNKFGKSTISLLPSFVGPGAHEDKLIGPWTFENGAELKGLRSHVGI